MTNKIGGDVSSYVIALGWRSRPSPLEGVATNLR